MCSTTVVKGVDFLGLEYGNKGVNWDWEFLNTLVLESFLIGILIFNNFSAGNGDQYPCHDPPRRFVGWSHLQT